MPRKEYRMTEDQLKKLLEYCRPTPCIMVEGYVPSTPQENANRAWAILGKEMGFKPMTVQPIAGKGQDYFTAEPREMDPAPPPPEGESE